ncbi:MAG TPA: CbtA family protein, partial [Propionibacteriaceae bacterium]|nr:CbtA family protein [Propionibacteriaceae bacterium]
MTSARNFLVRGLLAGLFAGLVAFGVAYTVGEPSVNASIAIEESGGSGHDHGDEPT